MPPLSHDGQTTRSIIDTQMLLNGLSQTYALTGEQRFRDRLCRGIAEALDLPTWVAPVHAHGPSNRSGSDDPKDPFYKYNYKSMEFDHCCANVAAAVARALDTLKSVLGDDEVRTIQQRLVDKVVEPFRKTCADRLEFWTIAYNNWRGMICADMLLTLLAVEPLYPENLRREVWKYTLEGIVEVFDHCPSDGEYGEGFGYWEAAIGLPFRAGLALRHATAGAVDIFTHPYLSATVDFFYHGIGPDEEVFHFGDCDTRSSSTSQLMIDYLAALHGRPSLAARGIVPQPQTLFDLILLHETEKISAAQPRGKTQSKRVEIPPARHFQGMGLVFLRSGWKADDTFVAIKGGPSSFSHGHLDIGDFKITAAGETLVADVGAWPYANHLGMFELGLRDNFDNHGTRGHSSLLVDGRGQNEEGWGKVRVFQPGTDLDLVILEADTVYRDRLSRFLRHLIFVKPDLVLICDDVRAKEPRRVEWLIQPRGRVRYETGDLTIQGRRATLQLDFLLPGRDGWVRDEVNSLTTYIADDSKREVQRPHRFVSFRMVHPVRQVRFLAALSVFRRNRPEAWRCRLIKSGVGSIRLAIEKKRRRGQIDLSIGRSAVLQWNRDSSE